MPEIEIYTTGACPYCQRAKGLLAARGAAFTEHDVTGDGAARAAMVERAGGTRTVPQIFIGGKHVGGCDDLFALDRSDALDALLGA